MTEGSRAAGSYLRFLAWGIGTTVAAALVGWIPTRRLAGEDALPALIAGCVIALLASAIGALPVVLARSRPNAPLQGPVAALAATGVRVGVMVALGLAAALSGSFSIRPLVVWIAIAYVVLLVVDTRYAVTALRGDTKS
ncbi:MAG TPA: hypothetical protein VHU81_16930 [Thermoanaerobaculia bacterium]|jgi:hypothetical protein|nr:hypothetical protein [Thermoanaerobaculia bacterium]